MNDTNEKYWSEYDGLQEAKNLFEKEKTLLKS